MSPTPPAAAGALVAWYTASVGNNFATPTLLDCLHGRPLPLNVLEQATMALVGIGSCKWTGLSLPGLSLLSQAPLTVLAMCVCNALTCYLFMLSLSLLPLSLCQTIRAATPAGAVVFGLATGRRYTFEQCASLVPMLGGFALAVGAQGSSSIPGVAAAIVSLLALNAVQACSRQCSLNGMHDLQVQLLQCASCFIFLAPLLSAPERASLAASLRGDRRFGALSCLNGVSDYVENVASTRCCGRIEPLRFAVLDTLRRFVVIVVCGFVLHGNPAGPPQLLGALLVVGGGAWYNVATFRAEHSMTVDPLVALARPSPTTVDALAEAPDTSQRPAVRNRCSSPARRSLRLAGGRAGSK